MDDKLKTTSDDKLKTILNNAINKIQSTRKNPDRKMNQIDDFEVFVDDGTGSICITSRGYNSRKSIILTLDELPERYQSYFAKHILCK